MGGCGPSEVDANAWAIVSSSSQLGGCRGTDWQGCSSGYIATKLAVKLDHESGSSPMRRSMTLAVEKVTSRKCS